MNIYRMGSLVELDTSDLDLCLGAPRREVRGAKAQLGRLPGE
jgi:hypothetical protein